jgi:anti-sigma B factor antagonist
MELTQKTQNGFAVVGVKGEVDMRTSPELRKYLLPMAKGPAPHVAVDLSEVRYIDSSGIATLIECLKNVSHQGGRFLLVGVNDDIYPVFELAHLLNVFDLRRDMKID